MKKHKILEIAAQNYEILNEYLTNFINNLPKNMEYSSDIMPKNKNSFTIQHNDKNLLFLSFENNKLKSYNVHHSEVNFLTINEYNKIVDSFSKDILKYFPESLFSVNVTNDDYDMASEFGINTFEALQTWEKMCNRNNGGISHPCDEKRWFDFITTSFIENSIIHGYHIENWLIEDCKWKNQYPAEVGENYDFSIRLLNCYKNL